MSTGARRRLTYANVMSTIAVFLALGGGAMAATHLVSSSGAISACANAHTGALRAIRAGSKCHRGEVALSWTEAPQARPARPEPRDRPAPRRPAQGPDSAGTGLSLAGNVFSVDTSKVQSRVYGECTVGTAMGAIPAERLGGLRHSRILESHRKGRGRARACDRPVCRGGNRDGRRFLQPVPRCHQSSYPYGDKGWQVGTCPLTNTAQARVMCASR